MEDYQTYASDLYDSLQGLWSAIQDIDTDALSSSQYTDSIVSTGDWTATENNSASSDYSIDIGLSEWDMTFCTSGCDGYNGSTTVINYVADINVGCPDCPAGNFTEEFLQTVTEYFSNDSNLSDLINNTDFNLSSMVSFGTSLIEFPEFPDISVPFNINIDINLTWFVTITLSLDLLLFIYRWYKTVGIVARIVRGKDVEMHLHNLMVLHAEREFCSGATVLDTLLNAVMFCHDKLNRFTYNLWKVFYWIWLLLKLAIAGCFVMILYVLVDQIIDPDFINGMGIYYFMTAGIRVQRSVRNEVLSTTALAYNNYTLANMESTIDALRTGWNDDAWDFNEDELDRVNEYNTLFCSGWSAYLGTTKDVTTQSSYGEWKDWNASSDQSTLEDVGTYYMYFDDAVSTDIENLFDSESSTSWSPLTNDSSLTGNVTLDFYLSSIWLSSEATSGWDLEQITLDWRFNYSDTVTPVDETTEVHYDIYVRNDTNSSADDYGWIKLESIAQFYTPATGGDPETRLSSASTVQTLTPSVSTDTLQIRIVFEDVEDWGIETFLNGIAFAGSSYDIDCPEVQFAYWDFEAAPTDNPNATFTTQYYNDSDWKVEKFVDNMGTYIELCPAITPIHGLMFRGFVGEWLEDQLEEAHEPFIDAVRAIALCPFYLMAVGICVLFIAYLFAMIMEFFLMKLDLYRENPYARVPLVVTDYDDYDPEQHETGAPDLESRGSIYGMATAGMNYVSSKNLLDDPLVPDRNGIEMGMTHRDNPLQPNGASNGTGDEADEGGAYVPPEEPQMMRRETRGDTVYEY